MGGCLTRVIVTLSKFNRFLCVLESSKQRVHDRGAFIPRQHFEDS